MNILGLSITRSGAANAVPVPSSRGSGGWIGVVREPYTGAWQRNDEQTVGNVTQNPVVFACVNLIACDISKLRLRLVEQDDEGIWRETSNAAWSPVLRKPNRYQTIIKFVEYWVVSKLLAGNAYVLKSRDARGVVNGMYVLDPAKVTVLVAPDGSVFYRLAPDDLAGVGTGLDGLGVAVPAREIIHDRMVCLFHPLVGVSPIYACGLAALQGLKISTASSAFFGNGSNPGGVLTAPGAIGDDTADRLKKYWEENFTGANVGKVAILGDGLKYEAMTITPVDAQLIEQLKFTGSQICACFRVPIFMLDSTQTPPYGNPEPLVQQYYSQCIQNLIANFELCLDEGLELPTPYGTEFDIDDLIWMDTATKTKAAGDAIGAGALSPDEARKKYFGLGKVDGGDTPYMQQQMFSLRALAERDSLKPFAQPSAPPPADSTPPPDEQPSSASDPSAVITDKDFDVLAHAMAWAMASRPCDEVYR